MAANLKTIQIPAEVKLEIKNQAQTLGKLVKEMQDIFANADPGSSFGKSLQRGIVQAEKKLNSANGLLGKEFFSEADLAKTLKQMDGISDILSEIHVLAKGASTKALGFETQELIDSTKALKDFKAQVQDLKKNTKMGAINGMVDKDSVKQMAAMSKTTGFSMGKTFDENYTSLSKSLDTVSKDYLELQLEAQKAKEAMEAANLAAAKAKVDLNMAQGKLDSRKQANVNAAQAVAGISTGVGGASHRTKQNIIDDYKKLLDQQLVNGQWASGGEDFAHIIAGWLEVDEGDLTGTATQIVTNLKRSIETAMKKGPISANVLNQNAQNILNGDASALQKDAAYKQTQNEVVTATTAVKTTENAAKNALTTLQAANNNVNQTATLLNTIRTQMAELKQLQAEYNALVDKNNSGRMDQLRQTQADAEKRARAGVEVHGRNAKTGGSTVKAGYDLQGQVQQGRIMEEQQKRLAEEGKRESEQFVNNLKQATKRWMGAQQVVNLIKRGLRQAYQDIKALDTAMTNIAVVTDMSIQELWGRIDQYMSIAQQYGVTTQGVYEVSQLYYQQGLSTNEVMAATTETLKLARIAGMDYKDAADAMTVAIRSFKMEMDDAQRVTDVYSKVAAITASDSEELAVAMSKTASSAESVGSSFENTTAMLAVMVETTRESAQNLGSALKSIISRYGEMKAGKTTDEDGEAIYYNKVDQALASVGISLKDAQGQFRDFDDVIFELSKKWDSLDKNTQRYIATIMAGNRQQSRFIALVDNWERLDEVSQAAADSADAGLLQYAKTLDSLDTKLNSIKTSFQEFYMSIVNGPFIGGILEAINSLIQGLNKLGTFQGILNLAGIIRGLKVALKLVVNTFSHSFTSIIGSWKSVQTQLLTLARTSGAQRGREEANAEIQAYNATIQQGRVAGYRNSQANLSTGQATSNTRRRSRVAERAQAQTNAYNNMSWFDKRQYGMKTGKVEWANNSWGGSKWGQATSIGGALIGGLFQTFGASAAEDNARLGSVLSGIGNTVQGASIGSAAGPVGALIGAVVGALASLPSVLKAFNPEQILKEKLEKAEKVLQEAELERAQKKETARNLESTIENLKKLQEARYESEEANQAFLDASSEAIEQFSELATEMDASGQLIVSINSEASNSEQLLYKARKEAADAALKAAAAESQKNKIRVQQTVEALETYYEKTEKFNEGEGVAATNIFGAGEVEGITKFANSNYAFDGNTVYYDDEKNAPQINNPENFEKWQYALLQMMADSSLEQNEIMGGDEWFAFGEELFNVIKEMDDYFTSNMSNLEIMQAYIKLITDTDSELITALKEKASTNEALFDSLDEDDKSLQDRLIAYATTILATEGILSENETVYDFVDKETSLKAERSAAASASEASDYAQVLSAFDTYLLQSDPYQQADWLAEFQAGKQLLYLALENTLVEEIDSIGEITDLIDSTGAIGDSYLPVVQNTMDEYYSAMTALYNGNIGSIEDIKSVLERSASRSIGIEEAEKQLRQLLKNEDGINYDWFINAWKDSVITADNEIRAYYIKSLFDNNMSLEEVTTVKTAAGDVTFTADLSSYDAWRKSYEEATGKLLDDNAKNRDIYYEKLRTNLEEAMKAAGQYEEDFFNFIAYGPINILTAYQKIFYDDNKLITSGAAGSAVAQDRIEKIKKLYVQATNKTGSFSDLKDEDITKFFELMQNNYGTYDWAAGLEGWEEDYVDLGINFEELAYENYLVHIQNIINEASGINGSLEQLAEKQNKGFSWEEAQNTLSLIQAIDPEKKWSDIFDVNSQGLIILKDFYDEANNLYTSSLKDLNQKQQELNDLLNINLASEEDFDFQEKGLQQGKKVLETKAKGYAQEIATAYGIIDSRQIDAITSGIVQGQIYSYESLVEFFNSMKMQVDDAANVFQNQTHSLLASQAFTQYNTEKFKKSNSVKQLFSIGEYGDLQTFWQERMAVYSEAMASAWDQNRIDNLEDEEIKKLMWAFAVDTEEKLQEKLLSITEGKTLEYGDYLSQFSIYDSQLSSTFGAKIDNYGQIIITNAEKWADFIATSQGFETDSDEYRQILAEAKLQGKIALESYASSLEDGITGIATGLINNGEIEYSQLQDIIGTLQSRGVLEASDYESLMSAYEDLKSGTEGSYTAFLNQITELAKEAGLDFDTSEINAAIRDAYAELISSLASALKDGVEGTLSNEDYTKLAKRYKLSGDLRTSKGVSLSTQSQQTMAVEMYRTAQASGSTLGVGEDIWAAFKDAEGSILGTYEDIEEEIAEAEKRLEEIPETEEEAREYAEDYLKVLKQIKSAARLDPDNSIFAFMEQDWGGAGADTFDSLASSIDKVKSSLQGLKEGEYIDYKDFANMMKFLNDSGQWKTFAENTKFAGKTYQEFVRTVIANTDEFGKVNLEGIALQMGVGIDTAMEGMTSSMTEGLKEVAQQQIKYLQGLEAFLKVAAAMEELGSIDLGIEFNIDGDLEKETIQLDQVFDIAGTFDELSKQAADFKNAVKEQLEEKFAAGEFKGVFEKIGLDQNELLKYLLPEGDVNLERIDLFGTVIKKLKEQGLSTEQWDSLALDWSSILGSAGEFSYEDFFGYIMGTDPSKIVPIMNSKLQGMLAGQNISITAEGATFKYSDKGGFEVEGLTDENKAALIAEIEKAYGVDIGDIVISNTGAVKIVPPEATAEAETLVTEFQTIEQAATAVQTAFTSLQEILNGFAVSDAFREFVSLVEKLKGGGASTVIGGEGDGVADGMGLNLQLDFSDALNAIDSFKSTFDNLKTTIESTPIAIQASSPSTINVTAPQNTAAQTSTVNQVTNVTQTITVTYVEANEKPEVVTPQEIEYHWKATNSIVQPSAKTVRFNWVANNPLAQWHTASNPVPVYFKWHQTGTFPTRPGDVAPFWTGSMNNISGAAYADGSIGRMHSGAELANKALVGELGPELAVYDGQYHMLGANGAEFVKLPSDAIVFNHKQTEGILKGQFNIRGQALAEGNVSGPAYAGGAAGALALVQDAISLWQGLLNDLQLGDLLGMTGGGGGGGGSGESIAAVTEELQEWYNLSRQIADIEGKINNLIAERQNLTGGDALKNLRKQQALLQKQAQTQKILLEYQRLQLERQKEHILNNSIWSQFLTFDESGNLQYIEGNETNGGKGALQVLDELNKMSGAEQIAFLQSIGYSYTDNDGKQLTGQDLVAKFFEELQSQISNYDGLYGIVQEAESALSDIESQIAEIEQTIIDNQIELENTIYDTLVEAIEREIEELEEQKDLIEEANKNYIDGLKNALSDEQKMYSSNENIGDRESLQRRLALLRRSGGSASEIYELEKQLDDMLKSEYFDKQQELIENISDANDEQVRRLEEQIKLQKESLEFQKEHGLLWAQVYDILSGSTEEILAFLQGNNSAFMESSLVQQQQMLLEWADQVGIYKEDQKYKQYKDFAEDNLWDTGVAISKLNSSAQSDYNSLKQDQKDSVKNLFLAAYANARLEGKEHAEALSIAMADMIANINKLKNQNNASNNTPPTTTPSNNGGGGSSGGSSDGGSSGGGSSGGSSGGSGGGSSKKVNITVKAAYSSQGLPLPASATVSPGQSFTVNPNPRMGYAFDHITYNGTRKNSTTITPTGNVSNIAIVVYYKLTSSLDQNSSSSGGSTSSSSTGGNWGYTITSNGKKVQEKDFERYGMTANPKTGFATRAEAQQAAEVIVRKVPKGKYTTKAYLEGGLVDYTGLAMVHGTPGKPEAFLNAQQTKAIVQALKDHNSGTKNNENLADALYAMQSAIDNWQEVRNAAEENQIRADWAAEIALKDNRDTLALLRDSINSIVNKNTNTLSTGNFTVAPGAITINVAELSDSYDVEELSKDIMNRMVTIASKATNRGVNRR